MTASIDELLAELQAAREQIAALERECVLLRAARDGIEREWLADVRTIEQIRGLLREAGWLL